MPVARLAEGNVYYSFAIDVVDDTVFRMAEAWVDREALETYMRTDGFQQTLIELREITILERVANSFDVRNTQPVELPTSERSNH
ncbi:hypothetical protein AXA44_34550 [Rhodococcus sp. SC4]|nr:hypothetical protein AXA44_34550 [Rhodococcus sp. SC4]